MGEWVLNADKKPVTPQVHITGCTFVAVGKQSWGPAIRWDGKDVHIANSVLGPPELLTWRYFARYKTRNLRRAVRTIARILTKGK